MIDVYHGTGNIDWPTVKDSGHSAAYIKATEGTGMVDLMAATNVRRARAAGFIVGLYHFFHADISPTAQAVNFCRQAKALGYLPTDLPLCIDLEDQSGLSRVGGDRFRANVSIFIAYVESRFSGRKVMIYGSWDYLNQLRGGYAGHPLWLAQYTSDPEPHKLPAGWDHYTFWQYSETGNCPGIGDNMVDLDKFNPGLNGGGEDGLRAWLKAN